LRADRDRSPLRFIINRKNGKNRTIQSAVAADDDDDYSQPASFHHAGIDRYVRRVDGVLGGGRASRGRVGCQERETKGNRAEKRIPLKSATGPVSLEPTRHHRCSHFALIPRLSTFLLSLPSCVPENIPLAVRKEQHANTSELLDAALMEVIPELDEIYALLEEQQAGELLHAALTETIPELDEMDTWLQEEQLAEKRRERERQFQERERGIASETEMNFEECDNKTEKDSWSGGDERAWNVDAGARYGGQEKHLAGLAGRQQLRLGWGKEHRGAQRACRVRQA